MARAIICGAGPAGATLAYLLAKRGVTVTLLERQTDFAREFRGEVLMPSGAEALRVAGLGTQLASLPQLPIRQAELFRGERRILSIPIEDPSFTPLVVPQPAMLEMIVAEAAHFPTFTLERGVTVRDLIMENGRVAGLRGDTLTGAREYRAEFVIACDGRASVIRKRLALTEDRIMQSFDVVWGHVPGHFMNDRVARAYIGNGHLLIMYPSPEGRMQLGWVIDKGTFGDFRKLGSSGWIAEISPHTSADLREFLSSRRDALDHPVLLDVVCDRLRQWTAPGLLLIGDAAHPMSPVGGQGINVALRDAVVAGNHLGRALAASADASALDDAAHAVQSERWQEIVTIQDMQQLGPRILMSDSFRSRVLTSTPVVAFAQRFLGGIMAKRMDPFLHGVSRIAMEN
jgi:2-polyprenyl-6-methoxyphenol hydroxylase-like FAD-dependent oxidoreductase